MKENSFFKTKAGGLTIAFIVIMIAFVMITFGLNGAGEALSTVGFVMIVLAMLYSPIKVYILDKLKK